MHEIMKYTDDLKTNINEIDNQHKKLVSIINELYNAMLNKRAREILKKIIDELHNYTIYHFSTEERYMKMYNYPGALNHISEHKMFIKKVEEFREKFERGSASLTIEIMNFLKDWLTNHIKIVDKRLGEFLVEKGVK